MFQITITEHEDGEYEMLVRDIQNNKAFNIHKEEMKEMNAATAPGMIRFGMQKIKETMRATTEKKLA